MIFFFCFRPSLQENGLCALYVNYIWLQYFIASSCTDLTLIKCGFILLKVEVNAFYRPWPFLAKMQWFS